MVKRIANHLDNMRAFDKQVDDLNRRRPNGASALSRNTPALAKDLRLHDGRAVVAAAADKPGAAILAIMPPDPFIASEARTTSRNATAACYNAIANCGHTVAYVGGR